MTTPNPQDSPSMQSPARRVTIPADVDREDRLIANLTARQLAILSTAAVLGWSLYTLLGPLLPVGVLGAVLVVIAGAAAALALVQRDGVGLDRLLLAAWQQSRRPDRLVYAPEDIPNIPAWAAPAPPQPPPHPRPAALWLPARSVRPDGVIDLGADGVATILACSTVSFALRTPEEQHALIAAYGRWLNSFAAPVQLLVTAERIDLAPAIDGLRRRAPLLPHPALERAALDHAAFLAHLDASRDLLRRRVLLVIRETYGTGRHDIDGAAARALRRGEDACRALAAAAVHARVLAAGEVTAVLAAAVDPGCPPGLNAQARPDEVITGRWQP
jgi:hypothetical protein